jgi:hypothetical protein
MSYLAAAVVFLCLEQPLASLEALTYRKPTVTSPKLDVEANGKPAVTSEKLNVEVNGETNFASTKLDVEVNEEPHTAPPKSDIEANGEKELIVFNKCADNDRIAYE